MIALALLVGSSPAVLAQAPEAPETGGPPWTFYMAYGTIAIAGITLILALLGYLVQSKGWSRRSDGGSAAGGSAGE